MGCRLVLRAATTVRRPHDTGRSGWRLLLHLVPFGVLVPVLRLGRDGDPGTSRRGPGPEHAQDAATGRRLGDEVIPEEDPGLPA
ncbi:DUF805 domain-containing protein [Streptomyces chilikensis]|uniref:DUF805 domain-containing protein n=1 Tax=Streptomyces chilikensis TaxID=1194079 RepID=UPI00140E3659|nr:DUF805 domain-containing protein [Streptomyces chilikensis]